MIHDGIITRKCMSELILICLFLGVSDFSFDLFGSWFSLQRVWYQAVVAVRNIVFHRHRWSNFGILACLNEKYLPHGHMTVRVLRYRIILFYFVSQETYVCGLTFEFF